MQYKCETCHDTGDKDKDSGELGYLNCPDCDAPMQRAALNRWLSSMRNLQKDDLAWAIHQRALAMAPKQEAPAPVVQDCGACLGSGWVPRDSDIGTEQECFSCDGSGKSDDATPAAANGALVALIHKAQSILAHHLPPDGPDAKTTISALLGLLDGPESRAALSGAKGN